VVAVGADGTIVTSNDGGQRLTMQTSGSRQVLTDIELSANGQHAAATTSTGAILTSDDGGQRWTAQFISAKQTFTAIAISADGKRAVAVGFDGNILTSNDDKQRWTTQTSGTDQILLDVALSDNGLRAVAVGDNGTILTSNDGGQRWKVQTSGTNQVLFGIALLDDGLRAVAVGGDGTILTSNDGGQRWTAQTSYTDQTLLGVALSDDGQRVVAAGKLGTILTSNDGGQRWTAQTSVNNQDLFDVALSSDGQRAVAVGDNGMILTSNDGGQRWTARTSYKYQHLTGIALSTDGQRAVAVGTDGMILASNDRGQRWTAQISGTGQILDGIALSADGQRAVAVGYDGTILTSNDGGQGWTAKISGTNQALFGIALSADGQRAVAVGGDGTILTSNDHGQSWTAQTSSTDQDLESIALSADGQRVVAVGQSGTILTSNDGGQGWTARASGTNQDLIGIALSADGQRAVAVGQSGTILTSNDGAQRWTAQTSGTNRYLNSIDHNSIALSADGLRAVAVGQSGTTLTSRDGGQRWTAQALIRHESLISIALSGDGQRAVAVGFFSTILKSRDGGRNWNQSVVPRQYARYPAPWYYISLLLCCALLYRAFSGRSSALQTGAAAIAASDAPAASIDQDRLDFAPLARGISRFLRNTETLPPLTLAITGEWGSGKSSLMGQVCDDLKTNDWRPVWFNAWHHQNEEQLLAALLVAVRDAGVPPLLSSQGIGFRLRLLHIRARQRVFATLLSIMTLSLIAALVVLHPDASQWQGLMSLLDVIKGKDGVPNVAALQSALPILGMIGVLIAIGRAMRAFGVDPAVLLSSTMARFRLKDASAQTSFRMHFAEQFGEVTEALAHPMVIVIDDLDRCEPDTILDVMEAVNFLTSSGKCYVIFGMATQRVQAALALSFKDIAGELAQFDGAGNDERKRRQEYARDYLEKLINIEILVPRREDLPPSRLLEPRKVTTLAPIADLMTKARRLWLLMPIAGAVALGVWLASLMALPEAPKTAAAPDPVPRAAPQETVAPRTTQTPTPPKPTPQPNRLPNFVPGDDKDVSPVWFASAFGLLLLLGIGLFLQRLRQQALAVEDTQAFKTAVKIWTPIATFTRNSPRSIKRFGNRIRYLAMLQQGQQLDDKTLWHIFRERAQPWLGRAAAKIGRPLSLQEEASDLTDHALDGLALPEHLVVALGALHAHFGDDWRRVASTGSIAGDFKMPTSEAISISLLIEEAIGQYRQIAGASWPPSAAQLDAFERSLKGVRLPGDGRTLDSRQANTTTASPHDTERMVDLKIGSQSRASQGQPIPHQKQ
jgi:photosystem II stability/assembly factor-like uncharacterized protein